MPGYDFPNSPTTNQQVTGSGGQVYTFDGTKWVPTATAAGVTSWNTRTGAVTMSSGDVTTALTFTPYNATNPSGYQTAAQVTTALAPYAPLAAPVFTGTVTIPAGASIAGYAPLAAPVFTGDARAVTPAYGDNDTSVATSAFVQSAVAPAMNGVGRNLVTNGTFVVQQRGAGAFSASAAYTADRWQLAFGGGTLSVALNPANDTIRGQIGDESPLTICSVTVAGTSGAGDFAMLAQHLESVYRLSNKTVTVSFWAAASAGTPKLGVSIDQHFGNGGSPSADVNGTGQSVTLSTTYQRFSLTFTLPSVAGKTLGTIAGSDWTSFQFWLSSGSANNSRAGGIGVQSAGFGIWGVQLEIGNVPTPLDAGGTPQQILAECQRFFQTGTNDYNMPTGSAGWTVYISTPFPVVMRATPTMAIAGSPIYSNCSAAALQYATPFKFALATTVSAASGFSISANWTASADL